MGWTRISSPIVASSSLPPFFTPLRRPPGDLCTCSAMPHPLAGSVHPAVAFVWVDITRSKLAHVKPRTTDPLRSRIAPSCVAHLVYSRPAHVSRVALRVVEAGRIQAGGRVGGDDVGVGQLWMPRERLPGCLALSCALSESIRFFYSRSSMYTAPTLYPNVANLLYFL